MTKRRRLRWAMLITLVSAGLLSGCYYYPYGYYPWGYPYPQPYAWGYPYSPAYPYPEPAAAVPIPFNPATGTAGPPDAPVQRAPLPPAAQ